MSAEPARGSDRRRFKTRRVAGLALLAVGLLLLGAVATYSLYSGSARRGLSGLTTNLPEDLPNLQVSTVEATTSSYSLYPGQEIDPRFWDNPIWAQRPLDWGQRALLDGFRPVGGVPPPKGSLPRPLRIIIPLIGVDAQVRELRILDLGDSRAYETPDKIVGHIPETANPGEAGRAWFFGHLESPILGEGNIFRDLPKIPDLLRLGYEVYVIVENGSTTFLYKVSQPPQVIHETHFSIDESEGSSLALVTCVPRLVYDHRLVITATLVGAKG
ncbi:MAG: sortase [Chloroflexi bacterium]|nr:sortase [Chloroflexota bacterium]